MDRKYGKEYAKQLKASAKELIDCIGTDNRLGRTVIVLIYGFVRAGFLEYRASKGGKIC